MWPIQLAFLFILLSVRYSSPPLTQCDTSSFLTWSVQLIFSPSFASTTFRNWSTARTVPSFSTIYSYVPNFNISLACLNWNAISSWKKKKPSCYWMLLLPWHHVIFKCTCDTETVLFHFNHTRSSGLFMYHQVQHSQFYVLPTQLYFCVLYLSQNKQPLFPYTALTDWFV